jgi:hypothetical protein
MDEALPTFKKNEINEVGRDRGIPGLDAMDLNQKKLKKFTSRVF